MKDHTRATHSQSLSSGQVSSITFHTKSNLNQHMQVTLQNVTNVIKVLKRTKDHPTECNIPKDQRERKFECIICRRKFLNKRYLKEHLKYKHGPKQYKCQKCEKEFSYRKAFNDHTKNCSNYFQNRTQRDYWLPAFVIFHQSVFKVIVLFYVSFSFTFILLSCLFSFCMYI